MDNIINRLMANKKIVIASMLAIGVLLLIISYITPKKDNTAKTAFDENEYISELETRVSEIVESISGAGSCKVMINLSSTTESIYVKENKKSYDSSDASSKSASEDSIITMKDRNGDQHALITKQIMPEIGGVTVVCEGGYNPDVKSAVTNAVSTVLGIGYNKVCVIAKAK